MSGAQLSNYATFLVHPEQAPLSIVLTALSTAAGVFMTPVLALLLLGARIPVDARGMALSITQIVLVPVLAGGSFPGSIAPLHPSPMPKLSSHILRCWLAIGAIFRYAICAALKSKCYHLVLPAQRLPVCERCCMCPCLDSVLTLASELCMVSQG